MEINRQHDQTGGVIGTVSTTRVKFGSLSLSPWSFMVLGAQEAEIVIGLDMMRHHKIIIDFEAGMVRVGNRNFMFAASENEQDGLVEETLEVHNIVVLPEVEPVEFGEEAGFEPEGGLEAVAVAAAEGVAAEGEGLGVMTFHRPARGAFVCKKVISHNDMTKQFKLPSTMAELVVGFRPRSLFLWDDYEGFHKMDMGGTGNRVYFLKSSWSKFSSGRPQVVEDQEIQFYRSELPDHFYVRY